MRSAAAALALAFLTACSDGGQTPPTFRTSVLLVTIDTLRADRLGCYGDAKARTPVLDAFARKATLFENAFSPAPITLPAHATMLTGLLPPSTGVRGNGGFALPAGIPTLAETLQARGRHTAAFLGGFPLSRRYGLTRGFHRYDDTFARAPGVHYELAERRADAVVDAALHWLAGEPGPVFVWVHLFDPHAPYDPPAAYATGDAYRDEIAAVDSALGRLLKTWDERGASVAVVTSDHGEAFGEHGEWSHGLLLHDTTLRVPLLIRGAGFPVGGRVKGPVGLADLAATILDGAGEAPSLPGASLRGRLGEGAGAARLYAETFLPRQDFGWSELVSWREGHWKYVRAPRPELFDLAKDPGETNNLALQQADTARRLADALERALAGMPKRDSRKAVEADASERLRALGYVQGPGGKGSGADPKDKLELARKIAAATGPFKDHADAARAYRELLRLDPENPLLNFRLADALLRSGRAEESLPYFRRVASGTPRTAEAHVGLAAALAQLERLDEAKAALEAGLAIEPLNAQAHYNLGEIARVNGQLAVARRHYEAARADAITGERARARLQELK
jgi:arylsulfatase A-like enzyme